jgi:hypothetical protein
MEIEEPINTHTEDLITHFSSSTIRNRIRKFFGLPKSIHGEYIDNERCSWRMFSDRKTSQQNSFFLLASITLLCATVFLEDAINYQSIVHKVTRKYLLIYRWFSSPLIKK